MLENSPYFSLNFRPACPGLCSEEEEEEEEGYYIGGCSVLHVLRELVEPSTSFTILTKPGTLTQVGTT